MPETSPEEAEVILEGGSHLKNDDHSSDDDQNGMNRMNNKANELDFDDRLASH